METVCTSLLNKNQYYLCNFIRRLVHIIFIVIYFVLDKYPAGVRESVGTRHAVASVR